MKANPLAARIFQHDKLFRRKRIRQTERDAHKGGILSDVRIVPSVGTALCQRRGEMPDRVRACAGKLMNGGSRPASPRRAGCPSAQILRGDGRPARRVRPSSRRAGCPSAQWSAPDGQDARRPSGTALQFWDNGALLGMRHLVGADVLIGPQRRTNVHRVVRAFRRFRRNRPTAARAVSMRPPQEEIVVAEYDDRSQRWMISAFDVFVQIFYRIVLDEKSRK